MYLKRVLSSGILTYMNEIKIRKATIDDLRTIQELNHELCIKENKELDDTINTEYSLSESGKKYFKWRIEGADSIALIAEDNGKAIGYLVGAFIETFDYSTVKRLAEAENMYIQDSYRGKGIGGMLIKEFKEWCRAGGAERIRYVASAGNIEAIGFYKKHGAKEVSVTLEESLI